MNKYEMDIEKILMDEHGEGWIDLLMEAKKIGMTIEEVREFFCSFKKANEYH